MPKRLSLSLIVGCLLGLLPPAYGQIRSGTITGVVQDPSAASVAGAEVVVTNTDTNATYNTTTTDSGQYTIPYLEAGSYSISITKAGFQAYHATGVRMQSSQTIRVDASLQIGSTESRVEVVAAAEQLQTDSSNVAGATGAQV